MPSHWWQQRSRAQRVLVVVAIGVLLMGAINSLGPTDDDAALTRAAESATPQPHTPTSEPEPTPEEQATSLPWASATPAPTAAPTVAPVLGATPIGPTQAATVERVIDGDTIEVRLGGSLYTVRYIGIDTPETVHPSQPVEWMGPEASAVNTALVLGRNVVLEKDVSETDAFGRLLRYVWIPQPDGLLLVNLKLVRRGFANASSYPPDVRYQDLLRTAEAEAREAGAGLWGEPPPLTVAPPPAAGGCDPSYPDVCILAYPPDLDCGDVEFRRFAVVPPDPHGFDGDHDGIGCES